MPRHRRHENLPWAHTPNPADPQERARERAGRSIGKRRVRRCQRRPTGSAKFDHLPEEKQVEGSLSVYNHPQYKSIHSEIRMKLEKIIGCQLYNTYYYDRFYFPGQELKIHTDRPACEISVSIHIGSNIKKTWPIWIKTPYGEFHEIHLNPGDGIIYKGCERPHWRDTMPGKRMFFQKKDLYYHQVFFHYVLANGIRSHFAFDR